MTTSRLERTLIVVLRAAPIILLCALFLMFGLLSPKFLAIENLINIVTQASYIGIMAVGMTFVLLTAGIDLSVGAVMYVSVAVAGVYILGGGLPLPVAVVGALMVGVLFGALNAVLITRVGVVAFLVTLGTLTVGRGLAIFITKSETINFPDSLRELSSTRIFGLITMPIVIFAIVVVIGHLVLTRTTLGRQIYAVGNDREGAKKAGINVKFVLATVYIISGLCAALGGIVNVAQIGAVNSGFGEGREFQVIAAAVLGGVSLFGGRGSVFPGAVIGAILVPMINAGLQAIDVEIYLREPAFAVVIFLAVLLDSLRNLLLARLSKRHIRVEQPIPTSAVA